MITLLFVFVSVVILTYLIAVRPHQYWKNKNAPQLETTIPFLGNLGAVLFRRKNMHEWMLDIYSRTTTRVLGLYSTTVPVLMIKDLNLIKQLGVKDFDHFPDHRQLLSEKLDPLFVNNLFALQGDKWRNMRATLSPAFTSSKMRAMFTLISDCAKQYVDYFLNIIDDKTVYDLEMKDTLSRFANDVIASTAFGIQCNSIENKTNEFYVMGKDVTNFNGWRNLKMFGYIMCRPVMEFFQVKIFSDKICDFFRTLVKTTIATREEKGIIRPDMIHLLIEARKGKLKHDTVKDDAAGFATVDESDVGKSEKQNKIELTDDVITAQVILFFIAGFETISLVMSMMAHTLAVHEDVQQKLQKEIDETLAQCNGKITYDIVSKMKYLDMVFSEILRLQPPVVALDRVCTEPYTIQPELPGEKPIHLKKNDSIWYPIGAIHLDPQYFPDPDKFDPERFSDENKSSIQPMSYMPFGIGPRNCIGSRFALMEGKIIFIHLLSKFSLVITKKSQVPLKFKKGEFNLLAEKGYWLGLKRRNLKS